MKTILDAIVLIESDNIKARLFKGSRAHINIRGYDEMIRDVPLSNIDSNNINLIVNTMKDYGNVGTCSIDCLVESIKKLGVETEKVMMNHTHKPIDFMNNTKGVISSVCSLCGQEIFATYWKTSSERETSEKRRGWYKSQK